MSRVRYIGDPPVSGGTPTQTEARAYFARMTTSPTPEFREAVNWAIWRWKALGVWSQLKGLWILAADTSQAGLLSAIGDTPRDATIVGTTPTFTARKGFSGFGSGKQIQFPITSTILGSDLVFGFAAMRVSGKTDVSDPENPVDHFGSMIRNDSTDLFSSPGNFAYLANLPTRGVRVPASSLYYTHGTFIGGGKGGVGSILPGNVSFQAGTLSARGSNYITTGHDLTALDRLSAYGFLDAAASTAQCRQAVAVLATMLDMLGALD